jgi:hypothetical protein
LVISPTADRANPEPLDGKTVSGSIYVFTTPDTGIKQVRYYIDRTNAKGKADRTDTAAPFDLRGGTSTTAEPFDTRTPQRRSAHHLPQPSTSPPDRQRS